MKRITSFLCTALILAMMPLAAFAALPATGDTGYLYNAATGKFLSHGVTGVSNSGALVDDYGVPVEVKNEGNASEFSGYTYLRLQMGDYYGRYLRIVSGGLDCAGSSYHKWAAIEKDGAILLRCIYTASQVAYAKQGWFLAVDESGALVLKEGEENAARWQWTTAAEQIALVDQAEAARAAATGAKGGLTVASVAALKEALESMTAEDKTAAIANPTMYAGTTGWTVSNIQGTAISNGKYEIENAAGTQATVSQQITGLTPGFYRVDVQAFYRASVLARCVSFGDKGYRFSNAFVQANANKVLIRDWYAISTNNHSKPTSRGDIKDEFNEGAKYLNSVYTWVEGDGVLDITVTVPSFSAGDYPNWICFNNVRLTYFFDSEDLSAYKAQLQALVEAAQALVLPQAQKTQLDGVIEQQYKEWTTVAQYETAIQAVSEAKTAAEAFAAPYAAYLQLKEDITTHFIAQTASYSDETGATQTYSDAVAVLDDAVNQAASPEAVSAAAETLWQKALTWMESVTVVSPGLDLTWMIVNADFSDSDYKKAWTETLVSSGTVGVTNGLMRYYQSSFDLAQTLAYTLPAGTYRLGMDGFERTNSPVADAYSDYAGGTSAVTGTLYLNAGGKLAMNLFDQQTVTDASLGGVKPSGASFYIPDGSSSASRYLSAGLYPNTLNALLEERGAVTLGYRCANTKAWTCFDNFRLSYMGVPHEEEFTVNATEGLTPLALPFDLDASSDYVAELCLVGGVEEGRALLYPVKHVAAGTPCVARFTRSDVSALRQEVVPEDYVLPWEGGTLRPDTEHFTWQLVNLAGEASEGSALTMQPLDFGDMDFSVNLENLATRKFLSAVTYSSVVESVVSQYNVAPPLRRDQPNRVMIPLPETTADMVLRYASDEEMTDAREIPVAAGSEAAYIPNLVPGTTCFFSVTEGENTVAQGRFTTTGNLRMLYIPTANNIRDLGGWATSDGRRTAYGHLFRGSALNGFVKTSAEDLETLKALGVGAEIDLRWKEDYDKDQGCGVSAFGFEKGSTYYFAQANDYLAADLDKAETQQRLKEEFLFILSNFRAGRAVYFHCAWGADRTGMLAFLLEGVLGVTSDGIFKDYELTSFSPAGNRLKSALQDRLNVIQALPGAKMRDRFEYYFLNKLGVSQEDINYFREVMVEGEDPTGIETVQGSRFRVNGSMVNGQCSMADGKYLIDGRLVIVRGGRLYNVGGQRR